MSQTMVRVLHRDGTPARGRRVVIAFGALGGMTSAVLTDGAGEARIDHQSKGRATLYVDGRESTSFDAPGTVNVTV